jgi:PadR family transcriptional regulator, regulatory protein PadR
LSKKKSEEGMRVGVVSLWLLLLLSEKPMYGYEIIRELEKKFSGYWKPKTGTIYPALEKLEKDGLVTSRIEFRDEGIDRKHYALTDRGEMSLSKAMPYWAKMFEIHERHVEEHKSILRYESSLGKEQISRILVDLGRAMKLDNAELSKILPSSKKVILKPTEPLTLKLIYGREDQSVELHMQIEWTPKEKS